METIDLSGSIGLIALVLLTLNMLMGMMLSTAYKKSEYWKKLPARFKSIKIIDVHNYTAYLALGLVFIHALLIPLDAHSTFTYFDILWPVHAPHQPIFVSLGFISLLALLVVVITTQKIVKNKIGIKTWRKIHIISYATGLLFLVHGLVMDPLLKDRPIDFIDPEKLIVELCGLILIAAFVLRLKYKLQNRRNLNSPYETKISD